MIEAEKAHYSNVWMCGMLGVARSSFYAWRNQVETAAAARRRELAEHIRRIFNRSRQTCAAKSTAPRWTFPLCVERYDQRAELPTPSDTHWMSEGRRT